MRHNEHWPAPEPGEFALFGRSGDGSLELLEVGRVRDPCELGIRARVAQHCRLTTVGGQITDWDWIDDDHAGEHGAEMEPWQEWPFAPIILHVWTLIQREPVRIGRPTGTLWLSLEAADTEAEARAAVGTIGDPP